MHDTKQFTPAGYAIIVVTILVGLFIEGMLRSENNLRSIVGAVVSVAVLALGVSFALGFGQKK